ncbi:E3 ubiquitin-protein ligase ubr1, partial [Kickxella alabastrina]
LFELSQRGIRNPPVFDHEDSRTLPSGTLLDAIPEAHAVFMHSLGKIPEIQYRTMFSPITNILRTSVDGSDSQAESTSPAQRLRTLVLESQAGAVLPSAGLHGDFVARTRLEMLKELGYALSPLNGSHITRPRDLQNEQSRWATGDDGMPAKPFLMQDNFALLTDISLSLVIPFGLDIWQLVRLFVTAELVRACVAVGDSILGEYTGAPKGLRIAQNQPVDMGSNPPNIPPTVHSAAATTATAAANVAEAAAGQAPTAASCVPHSWVDAPEARDVKLLSLLSGGSDASLLQESSAGIYTLVSWAIRQLQGPECDEEALERLQSAVHPVTVTKLVTTLLLPFLRRIALLFYLQYGVDIAGEAPWLISERQCALGNEANPQVLSQSEPECVRLLKLLHLPNLDQILVPETQPHTLSLAEGWLRDLRNFRRRHTSPMSLGAGYTMAVPIGMPTLYSLVDLPDRFEILFERSAKAFCTLCNS